MLKKNIPEQGKNYRSTADSEGSSRHAAAGSGLKFSAEGCITASKRRRLFDAY